MTHRVPASHRVPKAGRGPLNPDRVPASHRVPTASGTRPETDRVPASPAYVVAGMRDAVGRSGEGMESTSPRPPDADVLGRPRTGPVRPEPLAVTA